MIALNDYRNTFIHQLQRLMIQKYLSQMLRKGFKLILARWRSQPIELTHQGH